MLWCILVTANILKIIDVNNTLRCPNVPLKYSIGIKHEKRWGKTWSRRLFVAKFTHIRLAATVGCSSLRKWRNKSNHKRGSLFLARHWLTPSQLKKDCVSGEPLLQSISLSFVLFSLRFEIVWNYERQPKTLRAVWIRSSRCSCEAFVR